MNVAAVRPPIWGVTHRFPQRASVGSEPKQRDDGRGNGDQDRPQAFERLRVRLNDDGSISIDPYFEKSRQGIFAVGDVHGDIIDCRCVGRRDSGREKQSGSEVKS